MDNMKNIIFVIALFFTGFLQSQEQPEIKDYLTKEVEVRSYFYEQLIEYIDLKVEKSQKELQSEIDSL